MAVLVDDGTRVRWCPRTRKPRVLIKYVFFRFDVRQCRHDGRPGARPILDCDQLRQKKLNTESHDRRASVRVHIRCLCSIVLVGVRA